jgi:hypothetical protein
MKTGVRRVRSGAGAKAAVRAAAAAAAGGATGRDPARWGPECADIAALYRRTHRNVLSSLVSGARGETHEEKINQKFNKPKKTLSRLDPFDRGGGGRR